MRGHAAGYRRVLRRETHAPRTRPAVVVATVLAVLLLATVAAGVWWLADPGFHETLMDRSAAVASYAEDRTARTVVGVVALLVALTLLALALLPGRLARRGRMTDRVAILVDDGVLADAVADAVALRCGLPRSQVSATLARRTATIRVTPTSGIPVDQAAAAESAVDALAAVGFTITPKLHVAREGVIA